MLFFLIAGFWSEVFQVKRLEKFKDFVQVTGTPGMVKHTRLKNGIPVKGLIW